MRLIKKGILYLLIIFFAIWGASLLVCELQTALYKNEFNDNYQEYVLFNPTESIKVLKYTSNKAEVYYSDYEGGDIIYWNRIDGKWVYQSWKTIWSRSGSADGFIWPYIR